MPADPRILDSSPRRRMVCGCPVVYVQANRATRRAAKRRGDRRTDAVIQHAAGCRLGGYVLKDGGMY